MPRLVVPGYAHQGLARAVGEAHRRYARRVNFRERVRAGMVGETWRYPWSSAGFRVGLRDDDPLVSGRMLFGGRCDWREWLASDPAELIGVRRHTRTGRPYGSDAFLSRLERETGRPLLPRKAGRPRRSA